MYGYVINVSEDLFQCFVVSLREWCVCYRLTIKVLLPVYQEKDMIFLGMNKFVLMAVIVLTFLKVVLEVFVKLGKVIFQTQKIQTILNTKFSCTLNMLP